MDSLDFRLRFFIAVIVSVLFIGVVGFIYLDGLSVSEAFYLTVVTISTVGYGDLHPLTLEGRFFAIFVIIAGVGSFLGLVATVTELCLSRRERTARVEKLNMLVGVFFSELGTRLMKYLSEFDTNLGGIRERLVVNEDWSEQDFIRVESILKNYGPRIDVMAVDLKELHSVLFNRRGCMVRLLENPALMEHENFTELLHAVFHLAEELGVREDLKGLPETDYDHLRVDMERVQSLLIREWLEYMQHLKSTYPYLFSLAMRTNPFSNRKSAVVQ